MAVESLQAKQVRMTSIVDRLKIEYPDSKCSLNYKSPFQLLVATILSAQCTDKRVNQVTRGLFEKYPDPPGFINLSLEEIEREIYSTGFYKNKAKSIKGMATVVINQYYITINKFISLFNIFKMVAYLLGLFF